MTQDQSQNAPASVPPTSIDDGCNSEIEILKKQCEEYLNGWKRAKADFINFKNEQEKRQKELAQIASMGAVMQIIPPAEHLRKAFLQIPDDIKGSGWVAGIEQIAKQLKGALQTLGVEEYTGITGGTFNPELHQAIGMEYIEGKEEDSITQEINAGYTFHGKVLLPARVIVNKKSAGGAEFQLNDN